MPLKVMDYTPSMFKKHCQNFEVPFIIFLSRDICLHALLCFDEEMQNTLKIYHIERKS